MTKQEKLAIVQGVRDRMRVTKVVMTKSVKGKNGDSFAGFSSMHASVQEDAGMGTDLVTTLADGESPRGMTLLEARLAGHLLAMEADIAAHEHAMASGGISPDYCVDAVKAIRTNYNRLINLALGDQ